MPSRPPQRPPAKARNFVAKHSAAINKHAVHRDRKNDYERKPKHTTPLHRLRDPSGSRTVFGDPFLRELTAWKPSAVG